MRPSRLALSTLALLALAATTIHAQQSGTGRPAGAAGAAGAAPQAKAGGAPMSEKEQMVADLERQRKHLLDYINVAPDSMLRFRSTPGVRTYAQQIHHIASANAGILQRVFGAAPMTAAADTAQLFGNKAALRDYVNASYDYVVRIVRDATPAQLRAEAQMFGMTRTGARWVNGVLEHGTWTLGQTVPYLRMNGVTPPNYLPF